MNSVQEVIARVTGLDEVIETQQVQLGEITDVMEHLVSDNAMLQRTIEDLDYLNLFSFDNIMEIIPTGDRRKTLQKLRRLRHDNPLAKQAVKLVIRFTLGKGVQWILAGEDEQEREFEAPDDTGLEPEAPDSKLPPSPTKFSQVPRTARSREQADETDPIRNILEAFWFDTDNQLAFTKHKSMQLMLDDILTDGEKFYSCFVSEAEPHLKISEIPVEEIDLIIYDPDNRLRPVYYRRRYTEKIYDGTSEMYKPDSKPKTKYYLDYRITEEMLTGTDGKPGLNRKIRIPASKLDKEVKIKHVMVNEIWTKDGRRGVSELYASREWFRVFREFMEGRAAINNAAQAISYIRKIKGGPSTVAQFRNKLGGLNVGDNENNSEIQKLTRPMKGAVYDSNEAVDLSWLKTDTGAQNAKEDAKMLLATGGAGVGTMVHYFGEGGDANLATAQAMELPMVKTYEDWQQFIENFFLDWFEFLLTIATDEETAREEIVRIGFTFPPIISQDVVKYTTSWAQIVRDIAPNNMAIKREAMRAVLSIMGVPNIDGLMPEIEAEMAHAEAMRLEQQRLLAESFASGNDNSNGNSNGNGKTTIPNAAMGPNMKKLAAGKGEKVSNGPKPE